MEKKGQVLELQNLVAPLVGIGVVLIIGFLIFGEIQDKAIDLEDNSGTVTNETSTWTNNTFVALDYSGNAMELSCTSVYNSTQTKNNSAISSQYYTCDYHGLNLVDNATLDYNTSISVSYTYKNKSAAYNATGDVQTATSDIPGWLPIIVITVIGAILLGLISHFRKK